MDEIASLLETLYHTEPSKVKDLIRFGYEKYLNLIGTLFRKTAIRRLRESDAKCKTIDDYVNLAFSFRFGPYTIRPSQIRWEILQLMKILTKQPPKIVLEIGTAGGGTLYLFTKLTKPNSTIISIDLPKGYPKYKIPFYQSFASGQTIHLLQGDSHLNSTVREVEKFLNGRKLDFLFIDGDHSYIGVKKDFEMYGPLVRTGGIIAFHDIVPDYRTRYGIRTASYTGGVPKFWKEIKRNFKSKEIVKDWNQDGYGIGVIYK